jgi:ketosteroid isomerase-like protein
VEEGPTSVDRTALESLLREVHEHEGRAPVGEIASYIHPDCRMRLLVSFGKLLRGRDAVLTALAEGREASIYRARLERFEWLDETTVLSFGRARYALEQGGFAEGRVVWLDRFRDGLIWSIRAFTREADARRLYAAMNRKRAGGGGEV